ncbi:hypothetical protein TNCV_2300951 [Trichonephila clavipes]|nr:hypothetical protein TNCV_2300951 [Trichonephila clavipes]
MSTFKVTRQVGNPDLACVLRAELATMYFVSYNVTNTVVIVYYCKLSQRLPELELLHEKKDTVSYKNLFLINGTKYSTFQKAARAACLSKFEDFITEVLNDAASEVNLIEEER